MPRLSHNDWDRFSGFLRELYAQSDYLELPKTILDGLKHLIPCEHLGYNEIDSKTNRTLCLMRPFVPEVLAMSPVLEAHFSEHPQLSYYRQNADRTPYQITDFMSHREFRQMGIYRDFYRHVDTEHQLACILSEAGSTCDIGIGLNRKHKGFGARDTAILELARPHMIQARQNALAFTRTNRNAQLLSDTLDGLNAAVLTLDADGLINLATTRACQLLNRFFPRTKLSTRLPDSLDQWFKASHARLKNGTVLSQAPQIFTLQNGSSTLTVHFQADQGEGYRLLLSEASSPVTESVTQRFGLTERESQILRWISEGKSNPEIAIILQISPRTVHKHAEHLFAKLGVETRTAAARLAFQGTPNNL